jgi:membrane glycosyltransferase
MVESEPGAALVLTVESTQISACSSGSLVSKGKFEGQWHFNSCILTFFCASFALLDNMFSSELQGCFVLVRTQKQEYTT